MAEKRSLLDVQHYCCFVWVSLLRSHTEHVYKVVHFGVERSRLSVLAQVRSLTGGRSVEASATWRRLLQTSLLSVSSISVPKRCLAVARSSCRSTPRSADLGSPRSPMSMLSLSLAGSARHFTQASQSAVTSPMARRALTNSC